MTKITELQIFGGIHFEWTTGALDSDSSKMVIELLRQLNQEGKTVIVITHDPLVAGECKRVVRLADGRVV